MRTLLSRYSLSIVATALLASCGQIVPQTPGIARARSFVQHVLPTLSYRLLHRFPNVAHGTHPIANLLKVNRTLHGTTSQGEPSNEGTVFSISPSGQMKVLHFFRGVPDGGGPTAGLIDVNGIFYGATSGGGRRGAHGRGGGTVYSITTSGSEKVLYRFVGASDGWDPVGGLVDVGGTLYRTTYYGGSAGGGTVYRITTSGSHKVLCSFVGGSDGAEPASALIDVDGTLYGTTVFGGGQRGATTVAAEPFSA
jgi:uncharacterized repeat protein (TIGR03803 family)